ncbi:MAG: diguanylate cyclase domain-containing protein [Thermoanaerobaculia bacterium]
MAHLELFDLLQASVTAILFYRVRAYHPREFLGSWAAGEGCRAAAILLALGIASWSVPGAAAVRGLGYGLAAWFLLNGSWQLAYLGPIPLRARRIARIALPLASGLGALVSVAAPLLILGSARLVAASAFATSPLRSRATSVPALLAMATAAALELTAALAVGGDLLAAIRIVSLWTAALLLVSAAIDDEREAAQQAASQTEYLAYHDPLTGLANRALFRDTLIAAIAHAERRGFGIAVLFIDLDRFKQINDIAGHSAGDYALRVAAERMAGCLRREDLLARISGDEFVVLVRDAGDEDAARAVASKLLAALEQPIQYAGHTFSLEASVGVARYPRDGAGQEELLLASDRAMYRAKKAGGRRIEFAEPRHQSTIRLAAPAAIAGGATAP